MKTILKHSILALWLSLFCIVAFASCKTNDAGEQPTIERITERGTLLVGTTGDYRPLSYKESDSEYWGFGIDMAGKIADQLNVGIEFVQTSWPTLSADVQAEPLLATPFTHGEIGVLMRKGQDDLLDLVNALIAQMKADGTLRELHERYGLVYE